MASLIYNSFWRDLGNGSIDADTDTFKIMLVGSGYTENKDTHTKRSDVTSEITGTGYTAGGATLASVTWTMDTANDRVVLDAADPSWASSTITARKAVIYKSRGGASTADELVCVFDFTTDQISTNGTFTVAFNAAGILRINN
jgi:hypothetical protein